MDDLSLARLASGEKLRAASPAGKVLRAPLRMGVSRFLSFYAQRRSRPMSARASLFWGDTMEVAFPDSVSIAIYQFGFYESALTRIVLKFLQPGMTFFDVGAHFGYFTLLASHVVGKTGQVHSFEPTPATFKRLSLNSAGRENVHVNNTAVYSSTTTLTFTNYDLSPAYNSIGSGSMADVGVPAGDKPRTYQVPAITIDEYCTSTGARPSFMKLDAEGAEEQILLGMPRTVAEIRPMISLEVGDFKKGYSRNLLDLFLARGYQPLAFDSNTQTMMPHVLKEDYVFDNLLLIPTT